MQFAGNTALAEALESSTRKYTIQLEADWDGDGNYANTYSDLSGVVVDLNFDRVGGNNLPEEVTLVEGYQVGSLRATLAGQVAGVPVLELFSRFRASGPFANQDLVGARLRFTVTVETASGPVVVPQFLGVLRAIEIDSGGRSVDIEVLDLAGAMYAPIDLPATEMSIDQVDSGLNFRSNAQGVIDHVLRRNGIFISPPPPDTAILAVPGHGTMAAHIGVSGTTFLSGVGIQSIPEGTVADWVPSVWPGLLATPRVWEPLDWSNRGTGYITTETMDLSTPGKGYAFSTWLHAGGSMPDASPAGTRDLFTITTAERYLTSGWFDNHTLTVEINNTGRIEIVETTWLSSVSTSTKRLSVQLSGVASWRYFGFHIARESSTVMRLTIRANGANHTVTYNPGTVPAGTPVGSVRAHLTRSWSNMQIWKTYSVPVGTWPGEDTSFQPQADVPVGRAWLSYLPEEANANSLDILTSVVGAEYGRFGFNEEGRFAFRPADPSEGDIASLDRTVTSDYPLSDLASEQFLDSVRNVVSSTVRERAFQHHRYLADYFFKATYVDQFVCPPGTTVFPVVLSERYGRRTNNPNPDVPVVRIPVRSVAEWNQESQWAVSGFVSVQAADTSTTHSVGIVATYEPTGHRTGNIVVRNSNNLTVQFQTPPPDDEPALRIAASKQITLPEKNFQAIDQPSIDKYGLRSFDIAPSEWRSSPGIYRELAAELLLNLKRPVTTLKRVPMLGDPRDQIGDLHLVQDPDGLGEAYGLVQGIYRSWSQSTGLTQSIQYRVQKYDTVNYYRAWPSVNGGTRVAYGQAVSISTAFYVTSTSWINGLYWYQPTTDVNPSQMRLYRVDSTASGTPVDGTWYSLNTRVQTGWQGAAFGKSVLLDANRVYVAVMLFPTGVCPVTGDYWTTGAGSNGITNGPLVVPNRAQSDNIQGNFLFSGSIGFPTGNNTAGDCRWIDLAIADRPS